MARRMINISINVKRLDKNKLRKKGDDVYADITAIETPGGKYGEWMIVQDQTKEERERKEKGVILGNGKNRNWNHTSDPGTSSNAGSGAGSQTQSTNYNPDDIPF